MTKCSLQTASKIRSRWGTPQIIPPSFTICGTRPVVNSSDEMHKNSPAEPKKNSKLYITNQWGEEIFHDCGKLD